MKGKMQRSDWTAWWNWRSLGRTVEVWPLKREMEGATREASLGKNTFEAEARSRLAGQACNQERHRVWSAAPETLGIPGTLRKNRGKLKRG